MHEDPTSSLLTCLAAFFFKPSTGGTKHHLSFYLSQHGSDPEPIYSLHHLDPVQPSSKNCYASALFDSHNPDVLYGEVLIRPGWTQPTLSQEEIRKNGGVPPPPQPIIPTEFKVQLYNPDQQILIAQKTSKWSSNAWYEFSMPQQSFRMPSASALDRSQHDPSADPSIPKLNFVWRREGKFSKDLTCFLTGKSTDPATKKKHKDPDIAIALFSELNEVTIYEPNLTRVDMEDYKGLEVVLLLSAAAIKDVFFSNVKETFHIGDPPRKNSGSVLRRNSLPLDAIVSNPIVASRPQHAVRPPQHPQTSRPPPHLQNRPHGPHTAGINRPYNQQIPALHYPQIATSSQPPRPSQPPPPPLDPRSKWEIEAETARLKAQTEVEQRNQKKNEEARLKEKKKMDEAEAKRLRKMVEAEDRERKKKQAEVDKETERLRRKYGTQGQELRPPTMHQRQHSAPSPNTYGPSIRPQFATPQPRPQARPLAPPRPQNLQYNVPQPRPQVRPPQQPPRPSQAPGGRFGPYLAPAGSHAIASTTSFLGTGGSNNTQQGLKNSKRSFWGLRATSEGANTPRLVSKKSSLF